MFKIDGAKLIKETLEISKDENIIKIILEDFVSGNNIVIVDGKVALSPDYTGIIDFDNCMIVSYNEVVDNDLYIVDFVLPDDLPKTTIENKLTYDLSTCFNIKLYGKPFNLPAIFDKYLDLDIEILYNIVKIYYKRNSYITHSFER